MSFIGPVVREVVLEPHRRDQYPIPLTTQPEDPAVPNTPTPVKVPGTDPIKTPVPVGR